MAWTFPNVDKPVANTTPSSSTTSTTQKIHWLTLHRGARLTLDSVYAHGVDADGCHSTLGDGGAVCRLVRRTLVQRSCGQRLALGVVSGGRGLGGAGTVASARGRGGLVAPAPAVALAWGRGAGVCRRAGFGAGAVGGY